MNMLGSVSTGYKHVFGLSYTDSMAVWVSPVVQSSDY